MRVDVYLRDDLGHPVAAAVTTGTLAEVLAALPSLAPVLGERAAACLAQRERDRHEEVERRQRGRRRAHARAIFGEILRARGCSGIPDTGYAPARHAAIDHAADVLELPRPPSERATCDERWRALIASAVEHLEGGGSCVGLGLDGLDDLADERTRGRGRIPR